MRLNFEGTYVGVTRCCLGWVHRWSPGHALESPLSQIQALLVICHFGLVILTVNKHTELTLYYLLSETQLFTLITQCQSQA